MKYKNIVFDVGHVLLSYRWKGLMIDYGLTPNEAEEFYNITCRDPLWAEFDYENIPYEDVIEMLVKKHPGHEPEIRYFFENKENMPVARPEVYDRCERLHQKGYRLYILSNYSSVLFETHTQKITAMKYFDGAMVSYMIHRIKPDYEIYNALFDKYDILPEESLFFDDRPENVQASIELGMDAVLIESEDALLIELNKLLK